MAGRLTLVTAVALGSMGIVSVSSGQTPYGACPERVQYYQERYESSGQVSDMVCMQKTLERGLQ
ncbi:hypothetical protein GHK30_03890 [Sinorhizobium medicae]|nr:hypothetical protein [Sinorhizobium medicae]